MTQDLDLVVEGLNAYYGTAHVLYDMSLRVPAGRAVAVLGRNGVGKSTLLKSIAGAEGLTHTGTVRYGDQSLQGLAPHRVARCGVVLVPEDRRVFAGLTVEENIALGGQAATKDRPALGRDEIVELFPLIGTFLHRKGDQLSGGEQQLVAIARAVAGNPHVLLMDEPSAGLAPIIMNNVRDSVRRLREASDMTMVVAEQNADFALQLCSQVIVIDGGRIQHTAATEVFMEDRSLVAQFLGVG